MSAGTLSPTRVHTKERHKEIKKTIRLSPITLEKRIYLSFLLLVPGTKQYGQLH